VDVFELISRILDILTKLDVLFLQLFVLVSLLRVKLIQLRFVLVAYLLHLIFSILYFVFHVSFFGEESVQLIFLFVILHFDVHVERLDVVWFGVTSVFVQGQVVIG